MRMQLQDAIEKAIDEDDAYLAGAIVDKLWGRMNYQQVFRLVQKVRPEVTIDQWDELLYRADMGEP